MTNHYYKSANAKKIIVDRKYFVPRCTSGYESIEIEFLI